MGFNETKACRVFTKTKRWPNQRTSKLAWAHSATLWPQTGSKGWTGLKQRTSGVTDTNAIVLCAMKKHSSRGSNMGCYCLLMFNKYKIKRSLNSNTEKLKFGLNQNNLKANSKFHIPCSVLIFWNPWSRLLPITDFQNLQGGAPSPKVMLFLLPQSQRTKQHEGEATSRDRPPPSI